MKLVLENANGQTVRTFNVTTESAILISRQDTRRLEVRSETDSLDRAKIKFQVVAQLTRSELEKSPLAIGSTGRLRLIANVGEVLRNARGPQDESRERWFQSLATVAALFLFLIIATNAAKSYFKPATVAVTEQEIVHIVKAPPKVKEPVVHHVAVTAKPKIHSIAKARAPHATKVASVKRLGALAVFGSMANGRQRGGVNLGAVTTSAGPGLGGALGSGGVQTTLYGKGLVAAPLGAGAYIHGGGGYGTKGKGGGQAGYGKMSLVGSAGHAEISLGHEALVDGGLDPDLITDVINRHKGQFRYCYEQGLQVQQGLSGGVAVRFTIGSNGRVVSAGVEHATLNSSSVESCVLSHLKALQFPSPEGGVAVKVSYPFTFRRTAQG